jgi:hypothetical protein
MTIATAVPWYVALALAATFALIAFVWGESRRSTYSDGRYERLVGQIANLRTAVRAHHAATGHEMPDLWDGSPEPRLSGWDRFVRRVVAGGRWVKARFRGPAEVESVEVESVEVEDDEPACSDCGKTLTQPDEHTSGLCLRCLNGPLPEPTPGPKTEPIVLPGPATVPMQAAIEDDWRAQSEALFQQMLAEIRGEK